MTLTQLKYLVTVARLGSFARAARDCHVAQPTLSLQIQKLEQELGTQLLDRKKNPVVPTSFGDEVIQQAHTVLLEADRLLELVRENADSLQGTLSIGVIPTIAYYLVPALFTRLREHYPAMDFRIHEIPTSQILNQLGRGELDLGVLATPLKQSDIIEIPLYYEPFVAYMPPAWSGRRRNLTAADFQDQELILLGEEHCFRHQALKLCNSQSAGQLECGSIETIRRLVDSGVGMTLMPLLAVDAQSPQVAGFKAPRPVREVSLVYQRGFYKTRARQAIQSQIQDLIPRSLQKRQAMKVIGIESSAL
ncbi:MAG: LysR family transcriptional regulator [Leptospiraceae bacterium]|nr:LysR family transcriptional regulator [Leptospiraceae bacterium]